MQNFRVCILTAGKGNRLGQKTSYFNKSLLRVGNKAVISHTIDSFSKSTEFVIALGYKGDIVKQYLQIAYPDRKFIFIEVDKYSVPGSGPGYALNCCKHELQCPFYFFSCDTIIDHPEYDLFDGHHDFNWIGFDSIEDGSRQDYCTVKSGLNGYVERLYDKSIYGTNRAFVGLAFIKDYNDFWNAMSRNTVFINEEIQLSPALSELSKLKAIYTKWFDTGSIEGLKRAQRRFPGIQNLDKLDEELYIVNDYVIKYFHNKSSVRNRIFRAEQLGDVIPEIIDHSDNFYKYKFVDGVDLFKINNQQDVIEHLLQKAKQTIWKEIKLQDKEKIIFKDTCKKFYFDKTLSRLQKLYSEKNIVDDRIVINEIDVPPLTRIFNHVNWDYICDGIPVLFHGDFNFSNIVLTKDNDFKFIDWRQDFGGCITHGDFYYDASKLYHSFLFPHESIKNNKFYIQENNSSVKTFIETSINIEKSKDIFEDFIVKQNYDLYKVRILTALILLNMSPLHEDPIDKYLFYFGKYYLYKTMRERI